MGRKIRLLGEPAIFDADGQSQPVRGHQAWALLARVVLARAPLDRRSLASELFPETVDPLGSLRWCLASLRKALNASECLNGDPVECNFAGDIEVDDVKGSAVVQEDSSGDISLRHVGGDARVDRDSSGDIDFADIGRDAVVGVDGSGDITADGVKGNFTVGAKSGSSGQIRHHGVGGTVTLPPQG